MKLKTKFRWKLIWLILGVVFDIVLWIFGTYYFLSSIWSWSGNAVEIDLLLAILAFVLVRK